MKPLVDYRTFWEKSSLEWFMNWRWEKHMTGRDVIAKHIAENKLPGLFAAARSVVQTGIATRNFVKEMELQ